MLKILQRAKHSSLFSQCIRDRGKKMFYEIEFQDCQQFVSGQLYDTWKTLNTTGKQGILAKGRRISTADLLMLITSDLLISNLIFLSFYQTNYYN